MRLRTLSTLALAALVLLAAGCKTCGQVRKERDNYKDLVDAQHAEIGQLNKELGELERLRRQVDNQNRMIALLEEKAGAAIEASAAAEARMAELQARMQEIGTLTPGVRVTETGTIELGDVLFDLGSADVKPEGQKVIAQIADALKNGGELVQIDGHTDNVPVKKPETVRQWTDNAGLSAGRALAVMRILVKNGVGADRIIVRGFGETRPIASNTSSDGRSQNRRVELYLVAQPAAEPMTE